MRGWYRLPNDVEGSRGLGWGSGSCSARACGRGSGVFWLGVLVGGFSSFPIVVKSLHHSTVILPIVSAAPSCCMSLNHVRQVIAISQGGWSDGWLHQTWVGPPIVGQTRGGILQVGINGRTLHTNPLSKGEPIGWGAIKTRCTEMRSVAENRRFKYR